MTIIFKIVVKRQIDVGLQQKLRPLRPSNVFPSSAEQAIDQSHNNLNIKDIKGHILEYAWGRPRPVGPKSKMQAETFQILFFPA
ncbi:13827_t:CDS:2 [Funneliformis caledonium]|uniref:13827_t:CDS:1 n=1 Tax=Funneliformis caledonium TaxID=1117310 RepID=A0A9N9I8X9_9GLOM|nr:13827_t:CDS:2 [Funneliformis caledonium]